MWLARNWETVVVALAAYVLIGIPLGVAAGLYVRLHRGQPREHAVEPAAVDAAASPVTGR